MPSNVTIVQITVNCYYHILFYINVRVGKGNTLVELNCFTRVFLFHQIAYYEIFLMFFVLITSTPKFKTFSIRTWPVDTGA